MISQSSNRAVHDKQMVSRHHFALVLGCLALLAAMATLVWMKVVSNSAERQAVMPEIVSPGSGSDGRLVYLSGLAESHDVLRDPVLRVQKRAIALVREVEMYQWQEEPEIIAQRRGRRLGDQAMKFVYRPLWADQLLDSSGFAEPDRYRNPAFMPILSETRRAERVTVGGFRLSTPLISQIPATETYPLQRAHLIHLPEQIHERVNELQPDWLYIGNPLMPEIGDLRIRLHIVPDQAVSIIAGQSGETLVPYGKADVDSIFHLVGGEVSAGQMLSGSRLVRQQR